MSEAPDRTKDSQSFGLHMGALCDPIIKQVRAQGFKIHATTAKTFQKYADAITLLRLAHYLSDAEANKARRRLANQVAREICR